MTKPYTKTYSSGTAVAWWLTIKRGKPTRCTNKPCRRAINMGDRFLYRHGIPGVLATSSFCLACGAGIEYRISDRLNEAATRPINQQRILNVLAIRNDVTKPNLSRLLHIGVDTTAGHLKALERLALVERFPQPNRATEWRLTSEGEALADPANAGFPPLTR